jgi:hypothetical protein
MDQDPSFAARREELLRRLPGPGPTFVDLGEGLGRLEVWSEARWDAAVDHERPENAEHVEGLGWVVVVRVRDLN